MANGDERASVGRTTSYFRENVYGVFGSFVYGLVRRNSASVQAGFVSTFYLGVCVLCDCDE
jgi:hypothetical protein